MTEDLKIAQTGDKQEKYITLIFQLHSLIFGEPDIVANLANISAALKETFNWWWVGFYLVKGDELVLGPFQGPIACTRIRYGKGVCGTAWKEKKSLLVPDVNAFPGHIACSAASVSEIVTPILNKSGEVVGVLDVDSEHYDVLDDTDVRFLEEISQICSKLL
ncbi:MAG: GAF domain-containing protein [Lentimicrobium sp.]|jgi:GAF domain-containing protein|nr:GAF domain-containing protein [Lentimicrobium sp.]